MAVLVWAAWAALLSLVAWCARLYLRALRMHHLTATIPGPPRLPIIGNTLDVIVPLDGMVDVVRSWTADYGFLIKVWVGPTLVVFVLDAEDVQVVMTSPSASSKSDFAGYFSVDGMIGKGLLVINGKDYKRHRKPIAASMHSDVLQDFSGSFSAQCRELERRLDPLVEAGELVDVKYHIGQLTASTVTHTVLGTPGLGADPETIARMIDEASHVVLFRGSKPWFRPETLFRLSSVYGRYRACAEWFSIFADKVIAQKMQMLQQSHRSATAPQHKTFVDTALSSNPGALSRDELRDEIKTMAMAGISTSMDFLTAFLLCMSLSPEVQRRVQQELENVFGSDVDRDIDATDLPHLKYLECALKETLRLFSPAPVISRQCTNDVPLPSGKVLPKGCHVVLAPLITHRNPRFFPDPERFDPDRFLPERSQDLHPYAFVPFSGGMRSCPGQRYGMLFAKTVAASLLRRYDVLPDPAGPQRVEDVDVVVGFSLSIKGGVHVRLRRRRFA